MRRNIWSTTRLTRERPAASADCCQENKYGMTYLHPYRVAYISNATEGEKPVEHWYEHPLYLGRHKSQSRSEGAHVILQT